MKVAPLISTLCICAASLCFAQKFDHTRANEVQTIIAKGTIHDGANTLNVVTSTRGQSAMKMAVFNDLKSVRITIIYRGGEIHLSESTPTQTTIRKLNDIEAASYLIDLLSINPDYHFRKEEGFDLNNPIFKGYNVNVEMAVDDPTNEDDLKRETPTRIQLFKVDKEAPKLIREIKYLSFHQSNNEFLKPKEILFIDYSRKRRGRIVLNNHEYNIGLPEFLFELRDETAE